MKRFAFVVICVLVALLCACEGENPAPEAGGQGTVSRLDVPVEFHGVWQGDETVNNEVLTSVQPISSPPVWGLWSS